MRVKRQKSTQPQGRGSFGFYHIMRKSTCIFIYERFIFWFLTDFLK